ncbi:MAG: tandem-95 repeat protein [Gemmataceae bacterium]
MQRLVMVSKRTRSTASIPLPIRTWRLEHLEARTLPASLLHLPENVEGNLAAYFELSQFSGETVTGIPASDAAEPTTEQVRGEQQSTIKRFQELLLHDNSGVPVVQVWAREQDGGEVLRQLVGLGLSPTEVSLEHRLIEVPVALTRLPEVAALPGVLAVTPAFRPITRAGSVQTQGDAVLRADLVRQAGFDGAGIKVGVISDSALFLANSQTTADLPATVDRYLEFAGSDEGRAMMEIVHDIAPSAALAHYSGVYSSTSFASGIRALAAIGSQVIVDDLGYFDQPFFQDGIVAQAVNDVTAGGIVYVSAAGNDADLGYQSTFRDADPGSSTDLHDFDPGTGVDTRQRISTPAGYYNILILQWDDPFYTTAGVTHDFNVKIYDESGALVASQISGGSTNNLSTQQPLEIVQWVSKGSGVYQIEFERKAGSGDSLLKYILLGGNGTAISEFATNTGTIYGQPAAAGAIAVGAVPFHAPNTIQPYSSIGEVTILFDPAGNRLGAPEVRNKPDVVAPDAVNTTFFGNDLPQDTDSLPNFSGTSAAAPHVAGVAALLLDANPHLTLAQLTGALRTTAIDLGPAGFDDAFGYGRVDAEAARLAVLALTDTTAPTVQLLSPITEHGWEVSQAVLQFSEPLPSGASTPASPANAANYTLLSAGPDGVFGNGDDVTYTVSPSYNQDTRTVTLTFSAPTTVLPRARYRLTLDCTSALADPAGNALNGGVDRIFEFTLGYRSGIVPLAGGVTASEIDLRPDGSLVVATAHNPIVSGYRWPQVLLNQYDAGGAGQPAFHTAPTDIRWSWRVTGVDLAVNATSGVVGWNDLEEIWVGFPDDYYQSYYMLDGSARTIGDWRVAASVETGLGPRVDMNASGAFVMWIPMYHYTPPSVAYKAEVYGRRFDATGTPLGPIFKVSEEVGTSEGDVAMSPTGASVFVWNRGSRILGRYMDAGGNLVGNEFYIDAGDAGADLPRIAMAADGSFVVTWQTGAGSYFRRYDASANPLGPAQQVFMTGWNPEIAMASDGRFAIAWIGPDGASNGVFVQRFLADGTPVGARRFVNDTQTAGDQTGARIAMRDDGSFVVAWGTYNGTGFARWYDWAGPDEQLPFGPYVRSMTPTQPATGPVSSLTVTFDRAVDAATFTVGDVTLNDPVGRLIAASSVSTTDNKTFTITFPSSNLPGRYRVKVGPNVADSAGILMNQDGDVTNGETADAFSGYFYRAAPSAAPLEFNEGFEAASIDALSGAWSFASDAGTIVLASTNSPHGGSQHLHFKDGTGYREATLKLDLSAHSGATNLALDFWLQEVGSSWYATNNLDVLVSGDGVNWSKVGNTLDVEAGAYARAAYDLDQALAAASVAIDADVYIKFRHYSSHDIYTLTLDDIRVSTRDVLGPRIVSQTPTDVGTGSLSSITVTFDEGINPTTFSASDVTIYNPTGQTISLNGNPVNSGDDRTFTLNLASAQTQAGTYRVQIGPSIVDPVGNLMNQDGDELPGENGLADVYQGVITIQAVPQPLPITQNFDSGSFTTLPGWSFASSGGVTEVSNSDGPRGSHHLRMRNTANGTNSIREAVLAMDLSSASGATDLTLDFWLQRVGDTYNNVGLLYFSGDGQSWSSYTTGLSTPVLGQYYHMAIDLDAALSAAGITLDGDVFVKFWHSGSYTNSIYTFDDVRVARGVDVFGPYVIEQAPAGQATAPLNSLTVTFNEAINPASFTVSDVTIKDPTGGMVSLSGNPTPSADNKTFTLTFAAAQSLAGTYTVQLGPDILDAAGNQMNQDRDDLLAETTDAYQGTFWIGVPAGQQVPYTQGFESGTLSSLMSWSFASTGGSIEITDADAPRGSYHLRMTHTAAWTTTTREAILKMDLAAQSGATNLALDFWARQTTSNLASLSLYVSGNGTTWTAVGAQPGYPLESTYTRYAYDLDQVLATAGISLDADVFIKFVHSGFYGGSALVLDDIRISTADVFGPRVTGHSPTGNNIGPIDTLTITFDEPIDPTTFTVGDVNIIGPAGATVSLLEDPINSGDNRNFTLNLAVPHRLPGLYTLRVGPNILDSAGNPMNQDGDIQLGETNGQDTYVGTFRIDAVAQPFPVTQGFESGRLGDLPGWAFAVTDGSIKVSQSDGPRGSYHLKLANETGYTTTTREAVLKLDLSTQTGATNLALDFWAKQINASAPAYLYLYVSGDGATWTQVGTSHLNVPLGTYAGYAFDLDQVLAAASVALDGDVYLRFTHSGYYAGSGLTLDDIRVSNLDVFGPRVTTLSPSGPVDGPVSVLTVTFNEAISLASFVAADVQVIGPSGASISLSGNPVDSGDGRTFTLNLATAQTQAGTYTVRVGPYVLDVAGNLMNQDNDLIVGETNGEDTFTGTFQVRAAAQAFPYTQDFNSGTLALPGWSFASSSGTIEVTGSDGPRGSNHLRLTHTANSNATRDAVLKMDLSSQFGATNLALDFWAKKLGDSSSSNNFRVFVSGDGTTWSAVTAYNLQPAFNLYQQFSFDLDQALASNGVTLDADVYIRFAHTATYTGSVLVLDDIRVSNLDAFGPRVTSQTPATSADAPLASVTVTFNEPIDPASFTAGDVAITGPSGAAVALSGSPTASNGNQTFTLTFASAQTQAGTYTLRIGPDVLDTAGNSMNQNQNEILGESADAYSSTFQIRSAAQVFPYAQGFESGSLAAPGWSFNAPTGAIEVTTADGPRGSYHLRMKQSQDYTTNEREAVLLLDLAGQAGRSDLELDFWLKSLSNSSNYLRVYVSGNGSSWTLIGNNLTTGLGQYLHLTYDLDQKLAAANIALDSDVYVKFAHYGYYANNAITIDDIRVDDEDVTSPQVTAQTPSGSFNGPLNTITLTFNEAIDPATFTAADVLLTSPAGNTLALSGNPTPSTDNRTFTLTLAASQTLPGTYKIQIGPNVADLAGNELNWNNNELLAETGDYYRSSFVLNATAQTLPLTQSFDGGNIAALPGWSFGTEDGTIDVTTASGPRGTNHLRMTRGTYTGSYLAREAVLKLNLAGQSGANNLELDFWAKQLVASSSNWVAVSLSGNSTTWVQVASLQYQDLSQYHHAVLDLDQLLGDNSIALDADVYVKFTHMAFYGGDAVVIDDVRVSTGDAFGPKVLAHSPTGPVAGSLSNITVTFDEPIDPTSFTAADVSLISPAGQVLALSGNPVPSGDNKTFTLTLATAQTLAGSYRLRVGPDVLDTAGNQMNQDGNILQGMPTTDAYSVSIDITSTAQTLPVVQDFEGGSLNNLPGWSFSAGDGTISVTSSDSPRGNNHLKMVNATSYVTTTREAILKLDLSAHTAASNLYLDYWFKKLGGSESSNSLSVYVSSNAVSWVQLGSPINPGVQGAYVHAWHDLDNALNTNGITIDADVYVKFVHSGYYAGATFTLDDIRVSTTEAVGPRVTGTTPTGTIAGPLDSLTVTFNEDIDASSFTAADVVVLDPGGQPVALSGNPVDSGDHRTFTINLASEQTIRGEYVLSIGPDVRDVNGNPMNQDQDGFNLEANGQDVYSTRLTLGPPTAQTLPVAQGFEVTSLADLAGWSFVTSVGKIEATTVDNPYDGARHLRFSSAYTGAINTRSATLLLDLSAQTGATNLVLDYWIKELLGTSTNYLTLQASGNGTTFVNLGSNIDTNSTTYTHRVEDLDALLATAGIALDSDVYLRFTHTGYYDGYNLSVDSIRVRTASTLNNPPTLTTMATLTGANEDTSFTITHAALLAAGNEADPNSDPVSFRIDAVSSGTLTKDGQAITPGVTLVGPGESLVWTPASNANGTLNAFTVRAHDGDLASLSPVQVKVTVTAVNDAPVATGSVNLTAINEDETAPASGRPSTLFASNFSDSVDQVSGGSYANTLYGIAIINNAATAGQGTWQYSVNGSTWSAVGTPTSAAALVVTGNGWLRFLPAANYNGTPGGLTVRLIETGGATPTTGTTVDLSGAGATGGATIYSSATVSLAVVVNPVNDAPVLDNTGTMALDTILEDATTNSGTLISSLLASAGDRINDVDAGAIEGIAVTAADTTNGVWEYSTDNGGNWSALGNVSATSARLLASNSGTRVRFVPNANYTGTLTAALTFRAWDQATGSNGNTASTSSNGGTTAFSSATETASLIVSAVNDAPVLDISGNPALFPLLEDTLPPSAPALVAEREPNDDGVVGIAAADLTAANDISSSFYLVSSSTYRSVVTGTISIGNDGDWDFYMFYAAPGDSLTVALDSITLPDPYLRLYSSSMALLRVDDDSGPGLSSLLTYSSFSSAGFYYLVADDLTSGTGSYQLTSTLTTTRSVPATYTVAQLVGAATTDVDTNSLQGVAVVGQTGNDEGTWQYHLGSTWVNLPGVAEASALLLRDTDSIRYVPGVNFNGTASLLVRAWDRTTGTSGDSVDLTGSGATGSTSAFSANVETITISVTAVNDAPSFTKGANQTALEDAGAQSVTGWATNLSAGPADESAQTLSFLVTNDNNALFSAQPSIDATGKLTYTPAANANGSATVSVRIQDDGATANGGIDTSEVQTFTITVTAVNDAPSFSKGANELVLEDAGPQSVTGWATNISAGPANEGGQSLLFLVTNDNNALFSVQPSIDASGKLTYTPAANANGSATISVRIQDDGATANGGIDTSEAQTFTITVTAVNDAPSFTKGANQTALEDAGAQSVSGWATNLSAGPPDEVGQSLNFLVTNDNNALFSVQPSIDATGKLTYTPAENANGTATISVRIQDDGTTTNGGIDTSVAQTFTITVTAVNDVPSFTKGANLTVLEDAGAQSVSGWATALSAGPSNESAQALSFLVTNDNNALFSVQPSIDATGKLTYTSAANANGSAIISVRIQDDGATANGGIDTSAVQTFTITVTAVNDAPSFTKGVNQTVLEDAGAQSVTGWATNLSAGPTNESAQALNFLVSNDNNALFSVQPAIDATGKLTYTPAANAHGSATVSVRIQDDGTTANGGIDTSAVQTFIITVTAVNDAPSFSKGANQTALEDAGAQSVSGWATALSAGPADEVGQSLTFLVTNDNNALFSVQPSIDATGKLTYTPATNAHGSATVSVRIQDDGATANGGIDTSATQTFTITVSAVNDAPSFTKGANELVLEDEGAQSVSGWATDLSAGPADESAQSLNFLVSNDNNALFSVQPAIDATGKLTYTPAANTHGSATISVRIQDDGAAANGGIDTSVEQTFTITVTAVNDAPSADGGSLETLDEDSSLVIDLRTRVFDVETSLIHLEYIITQYPAHGSLTPVPGVPGHFTYTSQGNYHGPDSFVFRVHDTGDPSGELSGALDSNPASVALLVHPVNDAPLLDTLGDSRLTAIPRNSIQHPGDTVATLLGQRFSDIDPGAVRGIAVVGLTGTSSGLWQFSVNAGLTWQTPGTVSTSAALLLREADLVRFVPQAGYVGVVQLNYQAWDRTTGLAGGVADLSSGDSTGGTTAFSIASETASLRIGMTLPVINEDSRTHAGATIGSVVGSFLQDDDLNALKGIAVTGASAADRGSWQYSLDGGRTWLALGNVSPDKARLLRDTTKLRFLPAANFNGQAELNYHAWDQTVGSVGSLYNLTNDLALGGASAFSILDDVAFAIVNAVNDRPVLDAGGEPTLDWVPVGLDAPTGNRIADLLGASVTDVDAGALQGIAVIGAAHPRGRWDYQLAGQSWVPIGNVATTSALLLRSEDRIRFVPQPGFTGVARLTYRAWDQTTPQLAGARLPIPTGSTSFSLTSETASVVVSATRPASNQAPSLNTSLSPALTPINEDFVTSAGNTIGQLIAQAFSDTPAKVLSGLALTGTTGMANGTWQFSLDAGRTWRPVGTVSPANALLLRSTDRLRFVPARNFHGTVEVTYRAWDRTRGTAGARANLALAGVTGGTSAFGIEQEVGSLVVRPVNDRPVLNVKPAPRLTSILPGTGNPAGNRVSDLLGLAVSDSDVGALQGIALIEASNAFGRWDYQLAGGNWVPVGTVSLNSALLLRPQDGLRFVPRGGFSGVVSISYRAWDQTTPQREGSRGVILPGHTSFSVASETALLTINAVNDRPILDTSGSPALPPVLTNASTPASTSVAALLGTAVSDPDPADQVGMALTSAPNLNGTWQYSTDLGATWSDVGLVSPSTALLLRGQDLLRFVPAVDFRGTVKLSYRAWDQSDGRSAGSRANVTLSNALSFSLTTEIAIVVVNKAPTLRL